MAPNNRIQAFITADTKGFERALQRSQKSLAGFSKGFAAVLGGAAGGAGIRELDQLAKAAVKMADEIGKAAKTAGIGAGALQEYRYAAQLAGNTQSQLDDAVARFNRRLGEARNGNKAYAETFRQIGVAATDTNEKALEKTFDHLAGIKDEARRTSIATKVFGDDARRMALLVKDGADALRRQRKEARDLGIVLGGDVVRKLESAQDALTLLEQQLNTKTAVAVADNIEGFTKFKEILNGIKIASIGAAGGLGNLVDGGLKGSGLALLQADLRALENQPVRNAKINAEIDRLKTEISRIKGEINNLPNVTLRDIASVVGPGSGGGVVPAFDFKGKTPGPPSLKSDKLLKASEKAQEQIDRLIEQSRTPLERLRAQLTEIRDLRPFAENEEHLAGLDRAAQALQLQMQDLKDATNQWKLAGEAAGHGIADAFAGAIVFGDKLGKSLERLARQLANQALSNLLLGALPKALGGGGGLTSLIAGTRAMGGPVSSGRTYLVGERGPELFTPNVAGQIVPNGAVLGGPVVNVTNRFDVGLETMDARISQVAPVISASVYEAIEKARRRSQFA